jgi:prepilin-type N-terminal cleavage/methylation domain-containing protein
MKKHGFTIIELAIALAVSTVLLGIAIPRYNDLLSSQEFTSEVQKVAGCIQQAQSMASAPTASLLKADSNGNAVSPRWVAAEISVSSGVAQSCTLIAVDATTAFSGLTATTPANQLLQSQAVTGLDRLSATAFRVYFGVLEKGAPVAYIPATGTSQKNASGSGIKISIPFTSSVDSTLTAHIVIEQGGAPIHVTTP